MYCMLFMCMFDLRVWICISSVVCVYITYMWVCVCYMFACMDDCMLHICIRKTCMNCVSECVAFPFTLCCVQCIIHSFSGCGRKPWITVFVLSGDVVFLVPCWWSERWEVADEASTDSEGRARRNGKRWERKKRKWKEMRYRGERAERGVRESGEYSILERG